MSNAVHSKEVTSSSSDFFNPFYDNMTDSFYLILTREWLGIDSESIDKHSIMLSIKEEYRLKLMDLTKKVLIYEFHDHFDDLDKGNQSKNYQNFCRRLEDVDYCNALLDKYPVLKDIVEKTKQNLLKNSLDLINRYISDAAEIEVVFGEKTGLLKSISIDLGDTHRKGNSVAVLKTENGKIIYKPRSLKADIIYSRVLSFFNASTSEELKTPLTLDKSDYGWQEFIYGEACSTEDEIESFYKKLGMHLGFVYIFQGSDFHYENIIAHKSHPYLIDMETLFQPDLNFAETDDKKKTSFVDFLNQTVYRSLFFNNTAYVEEENPRDACALTNTNEKLIDREQIKGHGTDNISLKREVGNMDISNNLPVRGNRVIEIIGYEPYFIEGFRKVYSFIVNNKPDILSLLHSTPDFPVRVIVRPTYIYARFLTSLLHPKYLSESSERSRVLSFFQNSYAKFKFFSKASKYEIDDMYHGDIPYFTTTFKSKNVFGSNGEFIESKLINKSAVKEIGVRMENMSDEDCSYQVSLISMGLSALKMNSKQKNKEADKGIYGQPLEYGSSDDLIAGETDKILKERLSFDDQLQWISLSLHPTGQVVAGPLSYNLYDGMGGIGLYLNYHDNVSKEEVIVPYLNSMRLLYKTTKRKNNYSAYHGVTSYIYIMDKLSESSSVDREEAIKNLLDYCSMLQKDIGTIMSSDFIGGLAGVLKVLSLLYKKYRLEPLKQTADMVYDQLIKNAHAQHDLVFWKFDVEKPYGLTGFSHGQTGICYALSEYYTIIDGHSEKKRKEVLELIEKALDYEDQYYDPEEENWYDNRKVNSFSDPFWCHGAAGILLGRVKTQLNLKEKLKIRYIPEALNTTLKRGGQHTKGHSLCHGTMGNLDILMEVRGFFQGEERELLDYTIESWVSGYLESMNQLGWQNGFERDSSNLSFMMGKTGQLYTLLRYRDADLPSILTLS